MGAFVADGQPWEPPPNAVNPGYATTPPAGGGIGADVAAFGALITGGLQRYGEAISGGGLSANLPDDPILQAEQANKSFSPPGVTLFTHPIALSVAKAMGKEATDQAQRDQLLARWASNANPIERFGIPLAAGLLDPNNLAAAFIPGIGEETFLASLGKVGLTGLGGRVAARAAAGATTFAAATPVFMGLNAASMLNEGQQPSFDLRDAFNQLAYNAAIGAILHTGLGFAARDSRAWLLRGTPRDAGFGPVDTEEPTPPAEKPPAGPAAAVDAEKVATAPASTTKAAIDTAVAQTLDGRPVDVTPLFDGTAEPKVAETEPIPANVPREAPVASAEGVAGAPEAAGRAVESAASPEPQLPGAVAPPPPAASAGAAEAVRTGTVTPQQEVPRTGQPAASPVAQKIVSEVRDFMLSKGKAELSPEARAVYDRIPQKLKDAATKEAAGIADGRLAHLSGDGLRAEIARFAENTDAREFTRALDREAAVAAPAVEPKTPQEFAAAQQRLYRDGFAPGVSQEDLAATNAAVYGEDKVAQRPPSALASETGTKAHSALDERIADAERQLADAGIVLTKEDSALIEQAKAQVAAADQAAEGYSQAADCLTGAGV